MYKRKKLILATALLCILSVMCGCGNEKNIINDISTEGQTTEGGLLADKLNIPESVEVELKTDGTNFDKIVIRDFDVEVPESDKMYTKTYTMGYVTDETKENLLNLILDEEDGIYNYSQEYFDAKEIDKELVDKIFEDKDSTTDYSGEYFIGKIDSIPYVVRFMSSDWAVDEGFSVSRAYDEEIPKELADKQVSSIVYYDYDPDEIRELAGENIAESQDQISQNVSGLNVEQAEEKALKYMNSLGFYDVKQASITDMYRAYEGDGFNIIQYDADGYVVYFDASVNDIPLYQPITTTIDTLTHQSSNPKGNIPASCYYYAERSYYKLSFNEDGIVEFYGYWPMTSHDEVHESGKLITWDEALDSLNKIIPRHFKDYSGYSQVVFNNVRLTYFRTKIGDNQYEVIPVYVFSQVEDYDENAPIQLVIIDARDGSEVDIVQDPGRMGLIQ